MTLQTLPRHNRGFLLVTSGLTLANLAHRQLK